MNVKFETDGFSTFILLFRKCKVTYICMLLIFVD